ncbi:geranylgeranyl reductase family protein [Candidatus Bathyarchaeota archaeon]|nr:geranylgeranyl reductase family protein [Candidatus Bathyarchaeota archaeon]
MLPQDKTERFDAIVIGAGPSGSSCATYLSRKGPRVLLLDKEYFPRDKTCGDGISGKSIKILRELGLIDEIKTLPQGKISGVTFSSPNGKLVDIPLPKRENHVEQGYCIRRELLDNVIFRNAERHTAKTLEGFTVTGVLRNSHERVVGVNGNTREGQRKEFYADVVVGADGANSTVAKELGIRHFDTAHLCISLRCYYRDVNGMKGNIEMHFLDRIAPGYFWIFPMENGMANVGIAMIATEMLARNVKLKNEMFGVIENNPIIRNRFKGSTMVSGTLKGWTMPLGSKRLKSHGDGWLLVGDAASLVDPFTGEGIGNALYSGKLAAEAVSKAIEKKDYSKTQLSSYERALEEELDPELQNSSQMQRRARSRFLMNLFIHKAARNLEVRDLMANTLTDAISRRVYTSLSTYIRILLTPPYW